MACGGPSKEYAHQQGAEAFNDLLLLLKEKYNVDLSEERIEMQKKMLGAKIIVPDLIENKNALKLALQEAIWCAHAADF